jgi:arylsulfatase A-like enzyme
MLETAPGQEIRPSLPLPEEAETLAEAMAFAGFRTGMFYNNVYLDAEYGVQQGFETVRSFNGNGFVTVSRALEWMRGGLESRNFAFVHLMEPHEPYDPPEPFRSMVAQWYEERRQQSGDAFESLSVDRRDKVVRYAGEVAYTDFLVGKVMSGLVNMGLDGHTLVVLTSDHGEEFWEHEAIQKQNYVDPRNIQGKGHGHTQYDELLSVPLIVYFPGRIQAGLQIESLAQLHDLMPTILEWVGLRASAEVMEGRSLLPALDGQAVRDHAFSEFIRYGDERTAFRDERYKLIVGGGLSEFYDLTADPGERVNLFDQNPPALVSLREHVESEQQERATFRERLRQAGYGEQNAAVEVSPAALERLKALGYAN